MLLRGARIGCNSEKEEVTVQIDKAKTEMWTADLRGIVESDVLENWKAEKFVGRMQFTICVSMSRVGRAYVKPFDAQARARSLR